MGRADHCRGLGAPIAIAAHSAIVTDEHCRRTGSGSRAMSTHTGTTHPLVATGRTLPQVGTWPAALAALLLGVVILYGVGFASTPLLHNAAHDTRHSQGFPCH
jgi:cobalt transporter subunit CbtB